MSHRTARNRPRPPDHLDIFARLGLTAEGRPRNHVVYKHRTTYDPFEEYVYENTQRGEICISGTLAWSPYRALELARALETVARNMIAKERRRAM